MTTKWKIITGFVVMVIIVGTVVFIGYSGIGKSSAGFIEYRRLARLNVAFSDMESAANSANGNLQKFVNTHDPSYIIESKRDVARFIKLLDENENFARNEKTILFFKDTRAGIGSFESMIEAVQKSMTENSRQYNDVIIGSVKAVSAQLITMSSQALKTQNTSALAAFSPLWSDVSFYMSGISRSANTNTEADATIARDYLRNIQTSLEALEKTLPSELGQKDLTDLKGLIKTLSAATTNMERLSADLRNDLNVVSRFMNATMEKTAELNRDVDTQMVTYGATNLQANETTQNSMLMTGVVGLVVGMGIALIIVMGIIRVLRDVSGFASAVATGDFAYQINVKEKGEIGGMITAMRTIPEVLKQIISIANELANSVRKGHFDAKFDTKSLQGSFSDLGTAINTVGSAYASLIDAMPIPVLSCNTRNEIIFANKSGENLTNHNGGTRLGKDPLLMETGKEKYLGKRALEQKAAVSEEATIQPGGKRMEVAVTVIPSFDIAGTAVGYVEIVTDLTDIKDKQATMLNVARDASTISDRVAAASEELAAQVEQISRGAEMQRERVETTATAMNEMNATVLEVAKNASQASEQSEGTRGRARDGAELVNKVVTAINRVQEVGEKLHHNMQELGKQAESIGGVMNVISDIADQTNLLALNAAIEAARAGEAGRGFAVVADEVRKLAEKTMEATHEVGNNISAIQHSAKINIEEVDRAVTSVGEATELANSSGEALQQIVDLATANSSVVTSIATAAEEQSATSEEINSAIEQINRITGETTDGMVQSSEAVQELSRMAQELRRVMEGLR